MSLTAGPDPVTFADVRDVALGFPGVEEGTSYGTPAFRVRKRFLARLHDGGEALVLKVDPEAREALMDADPVTFYITEHYRNYPSVLIRLATVSRDELRELFEQAWREAASASAVRAYEAGRNA